MINRNLKKIMEWKEKGKGKKKGNEQEKKERKTGDSICSTRYYIIFCGLVSVSAHAEGILSQ